MSLQLSEALRKLIGSQIFEMQFEGFLSFLLLKPWTQDVNGTYITSHENKKALRPFYYNFFFFFFWIENECKVPYGCLTLFFYHKIFFYDKMVIRLFYFRVAIRGLEDVQEIQYVLGTGGGAATWSMRELLCFPSLNLD